MRKYMVSILVLVCALALVGCNEKEVNIDLPFVVGDVESIELYYYAGAPVAAEKKVVDDQTDIKNLFAEGISPYGLTCLPVLRIIRC